MIIIEGTDKAGKTTFLRNLRRFFPRKIQQQLQVVHFGLLPYNWDYCNDYLRYVRPNTILDRFIDSERAYGPVYRNSTNPRLSEENMSRVYRKCAEVGSIVVYCNPDISEVMKRIDLEGDLMIKKSNQLKALRSQFDSIFNNNYPLDFVNVDTTSPVEDNVYQSIVNKSIILERASKELINLNYRGFVSPLSKHVIYTDFDTEEVLSVIRASIDVPSTHFSVIQSRDIENKPVNISSLVLSLTGMRLLFVLGEEAKKDYVNADNRSAPIIAKKYSDLIKLFPNN